MLLFRESAMTIVERIAAAIAASRTGSTDGWRGYRDDAKAMIAHYDEAVAVAKKRQTNRPG